MQGLPGQKAWGVRFSPYAFLTIEFGQPEAPTTDAESLHGEWYLWLYDCDWRLEEDDQVIVASGDERTPREEEIQCLEGRVLEAFDVVTPAFDAVLTFAGRVVLRLFRIITKGDERESWMLFTPKKTLAVGPGSQWSSRE